MILAGVDLAWQSEKNPSAISYGKLNGNILSVQKVIPSILGIDNVHNVLQDLNNLCGIAIDAPLIINNHSGMRQCEKEVSRYYGSRGAGTFPSNLSLYPESNSVYLSRQLEKEKFTFLSNEHWQIECYPHPTIIEIFGLKKRLQYKKGSVADRKTGQKKFSMLIKKLEQSTVLKFELSKKDQKFLDDNHIESLKGKELKNNEDALDSLICLYISGLYAISHKGVTFGNINDGFIWIPQGICIKPSSKQTSKGRLSFSDGIFKSLFKEMMMLRFADLKQFSLMMEHKFRIDLTQNFEEYEKAAKGLSKEQKRDLVEMFGENQFIIQNTYLDIYRKSILIMLCSSIEYSLNNLCRRLQKKKEYPIGYEDLTGNGILRAKIYLEKMGKVDFEMMNTEWSNVRELNHIRNCIVHCNGDIKKSSQYKKLQNIIKKDSLLMLKGKRYIQIEKNYIEKCISMSEQFFTKLFQQAINLNDNSKYK